LKYEDWDFPRRAESDYFNWIWQILEKTRTLSLIDRGTFLDLWSRQIAERMILGRLVSTQRTWRAAARESMQGRRVYELLQRELQGPVGDRVRQLIEENARLIKTLPEEGARLASREMARRAQEGRRPEASEELAVFRHIQRWQARRIARTETAKAQSALTQARSEELGLDWAVWRTSQDERVRVSHRNMEGVLFSWNDPPAPELLVREKSEGRYTPGRIYNCRCFAQPVLRTDNLAWPHKVYANGVIRMTTLAAFRRMNALPAETVRLGVAA